MIEAQREALLAWYDRTGRPLPWRATRDPYAVLVSEVMAQQTQISRVVPYFEHFMDEFPTVQSLSAAPLSAVLAAWSGLGYNRRARYLHEAAAHVARRGWPETVEGLTRLPGVGPYTAAAVACFAFGEAVATVDTNARRVMSRWLGTELTGRELTDAAGESLDPDRPADWNQAIMDLGAQVCTPRTPACGDCPVASWCADPTVYTPPPRQPVFSGSQREARGAIVRALVERQVATADALARHSGLPPARLTAALDRLEDDGLVEQERGVWTLAGTRRRSADGS